MNKGVLKTNRILLLYYRGHLGLECGHIDTHLLCRTPEIKLHVLFPFFGKLLHFSSNILSVGFSGARGLHVYQVAWEK